MGIVVTSCGPENRFDRVSRTMASYEIVGTSFMALLEETLRWWVSMLSLHDMHVYTIMIATPPMSFHTRLVLHQAVLENKRGRYINRDINTSDYRYICITDIVAHTFLVLVHKSHLMTPHCYDV
jgi:hypothetical protein